VGKYFPNAIALGTEGTWIEKRQPVVEYKLKESNEFFGELK